MWIKFAELIYPVENLSDELSQIEARSDPCLATQTARNGVSEISKISIIDDRSNASRISGLFRKKLAHSRTNRDQCSKVEAWEANLHRARVVEP